MIPSRPERFGINGVFASERRGLMTRRPCVIGSARTDRRHCQSLRCDLEDLIPTVRGSR